MTDASLIREKAAQVLSQLADIVQRTIPLERGLRELSEALAGTSGERTKPRRGTRATPKPTVHVSEMERQRAARALGQHGVFKK